MCVHCEREGGETLGQLGLTGQRSHFFTFDTFLFLRLQLPSLCGHQDGPRPDRAHAFFFFFYPQRERALTAGLTTACGCAYWTLELPLICGARCSVTGELEVCALDAEGAGRCEANPGKAEAPP